jgi:predicted nucleic acid-binding protein
MYLVDTNIWLERLLEQEKAAEVGRFLEQVATERLFITDFAFHSIGIIMSRLNRKEGFMRFVQDVFLDGAVKLVHLEPEDIEDLVHVIDQFSLDFDDAYQYIAAEKYQLTLVSFDGDFDKTEHGRKTPSEAIEE